MQERVDSMNIKPLVALLTAALLLVAPSANLVAAHAELDRSTPKSDETVSGSPEKVEIWFTEEIAEGSQIEVVDKSGKAITSGNAELDLFDPDRKHLTVELLPNLPNGDYTVNWTSISAEDGDTETGAFAFTVSGSGTPTASPVASPAASSTGTPATTKVSGSLQDTQPKAEKANIDDRALLIAFGAGAVATLFIYGFWRLVRPKRHPFDRTER